MCATHLPEWNHQAVIHDMHGMYTTQPRSNGCCCACICCCLALHTCRRSTLRLIYATVIIAHVEVPAGGPPLTPLAWVCFNTVSQLLHACRLCECVVCVCCYSSTATAQQLAVTERSVIEHMCMCTYVLCSFLLRGLLPVSHNRQLMHCSRVAVSVYLMHCSRQHRS
jgi:hypothetical protein